MSLYIVVCDSEGNIKKMSDRASNPGAEVSEIPPSTTTISTVAVQAGRSKVVLAILRVSY